MPEPQIALKVALLDPPVLADPFTRTVSGSWGAAPTGQTWQHFGSAASFQTTGTAGQHIHQAVNSGRISVVDIGSTDAKIRATFSVPALAVGANSALTGYVCARFADDNNFYMARLGFIPDQAITCSLRRRAAAVDTTLASIVLPGVTHVAGVRYTIELELVGSQLSAKAWREADPEPTYWQVQTTDTVLTTGTRAGIRTIIDPTSTNTLPFTYTVDNVSIWNYWTDLAPRLHYGDGGGPLTIDIGRQTEAQDVEPTRIAATLKNGDGWLTPRNALSPYYGTWEQGRQVRATETVDGEEIDLATGFLEIPDVQVNSPNLDQPCTISAVDRLGRLAGAPSYDGTLAEHIRTYGGRLVEWFPLSESATAGEYLSTTTGRVTRRIVQGFGGATPIAAEPDELITAANTPGPPGDDQSYARWNPVGDTAGLSTFADAYLVADLPLTAAATDVVALSAWVQAGTYNMAPGSEEPGGWVVRLNDASTGKHLRIQRQIINISGAPDVSYPGASVWTGASSTAAMDVGRVWELDSWRLVTVRLDLTTGLYELWVGTEAMTSQTLPATPGQQTYTHLDIGLGWSGAIAHVQVRVGPAATTMTRAMHLAQQAHGYRGLHRQTVAERISTLAAFAGVLASDLELPAEASTPMAPARLASVNPSQAMQEAATTGQDILMTTPLGRITLVPRSRRYNQPVTMSIPFGWIMRGGIRYRPDKPVTDTVASRATGGTARRVSEPLRARYGVLAQTVTLDSDVDADPANWATWTLTAFGQPRTRCPLLRINLLKRATADRKALLRLRVGDRIQLTGMPAGSPEDVPHLIVQGIRHVIGPHRWRLIEFNTSPLLGPTPGVAPACPVVGDLVSTTAIIAY